jgi:hypothetical protein
VALDRIPDFSMMFLPQSFSSSGPDGWLNLTDSSCISEIMRRRWVFPSGVEFDIVHFTQNHWGENCGIDTNPVEKFLKELEPNWHEFPEHLWI